MTLFPKKRGTKINLWKGVPYPNNLSARWPTSVLKCPLQLLTILQSGCHYGDASDTRSPSLRKPKNGFSPGWNFHPVVMTDDACVCSNPRGWGENERSANALYPPVLPSPASVFFQCTLHLCNLIFFPHVPFLAFLRLSFPRPEIITFFFFWTNAAMGDTCDWFQSCKNRTGRKQIPFSLGYRCLLSQTKQIQIFYHEGKFRVLKQINGGSCGTSRGV